MAGTDKSRETLQGGPAVILVEPQLGENIGTAARAMLNFGLDDLRLVRPRDAWPNHSAVAAASGADRVLDRARVFDDVRAAVADLQRVYATTARPRGMVKLVLSPERAAEEMRTLDGEGARTGILFGPERSGLTNDDVALADAVITADLNPAFSSLNLAMAVLLIGYEWHRAGTRIKPRLLTQGKNRRATKAEAHDFLDRLDRELTYRGFFPTPALRPYMIRSIQNILNRAELTDQEVRTLHGILSALVKAPRARGARAARKRAEASATRD
ncbi:MAG: rRNA methyltransferase [Rhodospirillaceae bacterium]|nr:rRNA methyltransferase [Rhodospirillaceae bacterium]